MNNKEATEHIKKSLLPNGEDLYPHLVVLQMTRFNPGELAIPMGQFTNYMSKIDDNLLEEDSS